MRLLGLIGFSLLIGWIFPVGLSAQELPVVQMDTTCVQRDLSAVIRSRNARGYTQGRYRGNNKSSGFYLAASETF